MSSRSHRAVIARETLSIIESGGYTHPETQEWIDIRAMVEAARRGTEVLHPKRIDLAEQIDSGAAMPEITVANETTFAAGRRLASSGNGRVCCLNFASAKNPGGGFLNGSQAQEEALARASALYPCLLEGEEYYGANRAGKSSLYEDLLIYSPDVPVFRNDDDQLIPVPWCASIITAPAPNAGAVRKNEPDREAEIEPVFARRIGLVLEAALEFGEDRLVLGAWGCGVFRNDPSVCARLFREALESARFAGCFTEVHFAVLDHSKGGDTFAAFDRQF